jgi:hypothetical protein
MSRSQCQMNAKILNPKQTRVRYVFSLFVIWH